MPPIPEFQRRPLASSVVGVPPLDIGDAQAVGAVSDTLAGIAQIHADEAERDARDAKAAQQASDALDKATASIKAVRDSVKVQGALNDIALTAKTREEYSQRTSDYWEQNRSLFIDPDNRFSEIANEDMFGRHLKASFDASEKIRHARKTANLENEIDRANESVALEARDAMKGAGPIEGRLDQFFGAVNRGILAAELAGEMLHPTEAAKNRDTLHAAVIDAGLNGILASESLTTAQDLDAFIDAAVEEEVLPADEIDDVRHKARRMSEDNAQFLAMLDAKKTLVFKLGLSERANLPKGDPNRLEIDEIARHKISGRITTGDAGTYTDMILRHDRKAKTAVQEAGEAIRTETQGEFLDRVRVFTERGADGERSIPAGEPSVTVTDERLNDGQPTTIPLLVEGQVGVERFHAGSTAVSGEQREIAIAHAARFAGDTRESLLNAVRVLDASEEVKGHYAAVVKEILNSDPEKAKRLREELEQELVRRVRWRDLVESGTAGEFEINRADVQESFAPGVKSSLIQMARLRKKDDLAPLTYLQLFTMYDRIPKKVRTRLGVRSTVVDRDLAAYETMEKFHQEVRRSRASNPPAITAGQAAGLIGQVSSSLNLAVNDILQEIADNDYDDRGGGFIDWLPIVEDPFESALSQWMPRVEDQLEAATVWQETMISRINEYEASTGQRATPDAVAAIKGTVRTDMLRDMRSQTRMGQLQLGQVFRHSVYGWVKMTGWKSTTGVPSINTDIHAPIEEAALDELLPWIERVDKLTGRTRQK